MVPGRDHPAARSTPLHATQIRSELPDSVPGAIARVRIRPDYWLTAGMGDTVYTMVEGRAIYAPVKADKGINAAYFDAAHALSAVRIDAAGRIADGAILLQGVSPELLARGRGRARWRRKTARA